MKTMIVFLFLALPLAWMAAIEPYREGPLHDRLRGKTVILADTTPYIDIIEPQDGGEWAGQFRFTVSNFQYAPERATNPVAAFANGKQEQNIGHLHAWVFDEQGEQVRFYGAPGLIQDDDVFSRADDFPPGVYRAYWQCQHHDHTPMVTHVAPEFPSIASVTFVVLDNNLGDENENDD